MVPLAFGTAEKSAAELPFMAVSTERKQVYNTFILTACASAPSALFVQVIVISRSCPVFNTDATVRACASPALVAVFGVKVPPDAVHE